MEKNHYRGFIGFLLAIISNHVFGSLCQTTGPCSPSEFAECLAIGKAEIAEKASKCAPDFQICTDGGGIIKE